MATVAQIRSRLCARRAAACAFTVDKRQRALAYHLQFDGCVADGDASDGVAFALDFFSAACGGSLNNAAANCRSLFAALAMASACPCPSGRPAG